MEIKSEEYKQFLEEKFLSASEAAELLEVSEEELWHVVRHHEVPAHTAGAIVRFKKSDIEALKIKWRINRELFPEKSAHFDHKDTVMRASVWDKIADFWYFNDFYILCSIVIVGIVYLILTTQ